MITAPFNFVPLSEKVFFPPWAENVSHDVPFEDGESGVIDITITAKSPIFIRDHSSDKNNPSTEFCNHNGQYYIPSSSVKGMVRNVLEIMSFSKLSFFDDDTYAVRDLSDSNNFYMKEMKKDTFCGWLKKDGDRFIIEDCGSAGRVQHEEIDKIFKMDFAAKFKAGKFGNKADDKTALKKYEMIESDSFRYPFKHSSTSTVGDKRYSYDESSSLKGTIVLTGQPSARDESRKIPSGKVYEFVFFDVKREIEVSEDVMNNFLFAYFDKRTTEPKESPDWSYWKEKLYDGKKIPIFFQKSGNQIAHFGLSYLYKLPYKHSVKDGLGDIHFDKRHDLAQTIFGYADEKDSLKGRVNFSHFKATSNLKELDEKTEILGTPRASYYPIYVKQQDGNLFTTFMDNFSIAGWKRYPIHKGKGTKETEDTGNENVGTTFRPLKDGAVFSGKLRYHNLKKAELGALLSALTFHNTPNTFHNIGMAKSLGYGKITIKIDSVDDMKTYLKEFELEVTQQIEDFKDTPQLKELLSMASEQNNSGNSALKYMELEEFAKNKTGTKDFLRNYTALNSIKTIVLNTLISQEDLKLLEIKQRELKEQEEQRKEQEKLDLEQKMAYEEVSKTNNIDILQNFINRYPDYELIEEIKSRKLALDSTLQENRYKEVDEKAKNAYEVLMKKKGNPKQYQKELKSFIKKWEAKKNNKGSSFVLNLVKELKSL
ncbi:MAG: TIGR03986 family CRISPR-associated RAMP protein [Campylobacterota bacterium]|nr:TIGR03986 family CRISPR-associated RAMP protein [Campylobacterota bacterium]